MNIGIIGAGNIGGNLTRRFQELCHKVFVGNSRLLADLDVFMQSMMDEISPIFGVIQTVPSVEA